MAIDGRGPLHLLSMLVLAGLLVAACGDTGPTGIAPGPTPPPMIGSPSAPTGIPGPGSPAITGATPSVAAGATPSLAASASPGDHPDLAAVQVKVEPLVGGLTNPLWVTGAGDGSGRLFVAEQAGRIRVVQGGQVVAKPFLDITDRVLSGGERGLLGFAFPPGFGPTRPMVFVHYSDRNGDTTISEFRLDPNDAASSTRPPSA